jgi:hypothetical protein
MRNYLLETAQTETVVIKAKPLFFPVKFELPEDMKEHLPASVTRPYEGYFVMRFYCQPMAGDTIEHGGLIWQVARLAHSPQRKGSPKGDECPIVITEFVGSLTQ